MAEDHTGRLRRHAVHPQQLTQRRRITPVGLLLLALLRLNQDHAMAAIILQHSQQTIVEPADFHHRNKRLAPHGAVARQRELVNGSEATRNRAAQGQSHRELLIYSHSAEIDRSMIPTPARGAAPGPPGFSKALLRCPSQRSDKNKNSPRQEPALELRAPRRTSARLVLVRLRPRRAELRFNGQDHCTNQRNAKSPLDSFRGRYQRDDGKSAGECSCCSARSM